jgi:hypothetical protein
MNKEEREEYVQGLCKKYRPTAKRCELLPAVLHEHLGLEKYPDNRALYASDIAAVVHYCYYPMSDPGNIARIMAKR